MVELLQGRSEPNNCTPVFRSGQQEPRHCQGHAVFRIHETRAPPPSPDFVPCHTPHNTRQFLYQYAYGLKTFTRIADKGYRKQRGARSSHFVKGSIGQENTP
jgi:hypothetical protein